MQLVNVEQIVQLANVERIVRAANVEQIMQLANVEQIVKQNWKAGRRQLQTDSCIKSTEKGTNN